MTHHTPPATPSGRRHLPSLDGVRGLAIAVVVLHNLNLLTEPVGLGARLGALVLERGWIGVQLFFVLSGFLITGILMDSRGQPQPWRRFMIARVLRIWPLYYAVLLVVLLLMPALGLGGGASPAMSAALTLFVSNWAQALAPGTSPLPHFWSLAVEEQFYLLWPLLIWRLSPRGVFALSLAVTVGALIARLALLLGAGVQPEAIYELTLCRMDALACGSAAAALLRWPAWRDHVLAAPRPLWLTGIAVLVLAGLCSKAYSQYTLLTQSAGYLALSVGFALCVLAAACADLSETRSRWSGLLRHPALGRLGLYSYGMYVLHIPLHTFVSVPLLRHYGLLSSQDPLLALGYLVVGAALTLVAGAASYHLFEIHFLRRKPGWREA